MKINWFDVTNQYGKKIKLKDLESSYTVLHFFFSTCGGYCPMITRKLKVSYDELSNSKEIRFVSVSVTPNSDKTKNLFSYGDRFSINDSSWDLVRGDRVLTYKMAREDLQSDISVDMKKNEDQFVHSETVYILDKNGFVRGMYNGNNLQSVKKMTRDIKKVT